MIIVVAIVATLLVLAAVPFVGCHLQEEYSAYAVAKSYAIVAVLMIILVALLFFFGPESSQAGANVLAFIAAGFLFLTGVSYSIAEARAPKPSKPIKTPFVGEPPSK